MEKASCEQPFHEAECRAGDENYGPKRKMGLKAATPAAYYGPAASDMKRAFGPHSLQPS